MRSLVRAVCVSLVLAFVCCQEERPQVVGTPEIRPDVPKTTLVGRSRVFHEGKLVATLKTYRFDDGTNRTITKVVDLRDNALGYLTEDGKAFRYTAHGGTELVANSSDLRRNVAAIVGMPTAQFTIEKDA